MDSPAVVDDSTASFCSAADVVMAESAAVRRPADGCESSCPGCILRGNMATGILPGQPIGSLHLGPQTTNVAEGFHSGLNSRFGMFHPSLRLFLG